jgi:hypothetical protein
MNRLSVPVGFETGHGDFYGLELGPMTYRKNVIGAQMGADNVAGSLSGLQIGLKNEGNVRHGVQAGFYNNDVQLTRSRKPPVSDCVQLGVYNASRRNNLRGAQIGVLNYSEEKIAGLQAGGLNIVGDQYTETGELRKHIQSSSGVQAGIMNVSQEYKGLQIGPVNIAVDRFDGVQIGLLCKAPCEGTYFQLGLVTCRTDEKGNVVGWSPLMGWKRGE